MKKTNISATMKLIEKFDLQLRDMLMSDLRSVRSAKIKVMDHLKNQERLMTA